jgi:Protein of unknown function (DUF3618)
MTTSNDPDEIRADIERTRAALSDDVDDLAESVRPKNVAQRQVDKVKEAASNVKERVMGSDDDDYSGSAVGTVSDRGYAAKDTAAEKAYAARDTVSEKASEAGEAVRQAPRRMRRKTQGNPLAAGVIAFGLGMLVSSLIPSTEKEREAVSQLQENLAPVKEKASEVAKDIGDSLKPAAQEAAESVKTTAQESVESVKQEGQSAAADVKGQAQASKETVQQQSS